LQCCKSKQGREAAHMQTEATQKCEIYLFN